ncbi:hypothetical protein QE152_g8236 [Popillia japonica]|uniref:Uncharacterized protein n=1 Tax=Popillia japonica TaxID=7064 RepID=A0AAW1M4L3_POPJA
MAPQPRRDPISLVHLHLDLRYPAPPSSQPFLPLPVHVGFRPNTAFHSLTPTANVADHPPSPALISPVVLPLPPPRPPLTVTTFLFGRDTSATARYHF